MTIVHTGTIPWGAGAETVLWNQTKIGESYQSQGLKIKKEMFKHLLQLSTLIESGLIKNLQVTDVLW